MDWFVVATKPNREKTAEANLQRQGFEAFLPLIEKNRSHARRVDKVLRPFFPGYLFVRFNSNITPWRSINSTIGVRHILINNGKPHPVVKNFVEILLSRLNVRGAIEERERPLTVGSKVEIATGAMQGQIATILSANERGRVKILLSIMGGGVVSSIFAEDLELVS
jgi:transcriptional antiterminator RfaH